MRRGRRVAKSASKLYLDAYGDRRDVTSSALRSLAKTQQLPIVVNWFLRDHKAPAGEESGPQEILDGEFFGVVSDGVLKAATKFLESADGRKHRVWLDGPKYVSIFELVFYYDAIVDDHRDLVADHDQVDARLARGAPTSFGTAYDRDVRRTVQAHAADLRALLAKAEPKPIEHGSIGHNQPPSDIELDEERKEELKEAVETISEELGREQPDVRNVSRAARAIQSIGRWAAKKFDMTLDAFLTSFGSTLGKGAAIGVGVIGLGVVLQMAMELWGLVVDWLITVILPF